MTTSFRVRSTVTPVAIFVGLTGRVSGFFGSQGELAFCPSVNLISRLVDSQEYYSYLPSNPGEVSGQRRTLEEFDAVRQDQSSLVFGATGLHAKRVLQEPNWYLTMYPSADEFFYWVKQHLPSANLGYIQPPPVGRIAPLYIDMVKLKDALGDLTNFDTALDDPNDGNFIRLPVKNLNLSNSYATDQGLSITVDYIKVMVRIETPRLPKLCRPTNLRVISTHRDPHNPRDLNSLPTYPTTVPMSILETGGHTDPYDVDNYLMYGFPELQGVSCRDGGFPDSANGVPDVVIPANARYHNITNVRSFSGPFLTAYQSGAGGAEAGLEHYFYPEQLPNSVIETPRGRVYRAEQVAEAVWPIRHYPHFVPGEAVSDVQALEGASQTDLDFYFNSADNTPQTGYALVSAEFEPIVISYDPVYDYVRHIVDVLSMEVYVEATRLERPVLQTITLNPLAGVAPAKVALVAVGIDPNLGPNDANFHHPIDFYEVDWGDGTVETSAKIRFLELSGQPPAPDGTPSHDIRSPQPPPDQTMHHTYKAGGTYLIVVTAITYGCYRSLPLTTSIKISDLNIKPALPDAPPKGEASNDPSFVVFYPAPVS